MPEIASCASGRHQPPLVSAGSAHTTEPPDCGVPAVVGVVLALFAPPPPLPPLEHAAANSVSTTTDAASERRRRGRMISDMVLPPGSGTTIALIACLTTMIHVAGARRHQVSPERIGTRLDRIRRALVGEADAVLAVWAAPVLDDLAVRDANDARCR